MKFIAQASLVVVGLCATFVVSSPAPVVRPVETIDVRSFCLEERLELTWPGFFRVNFKPARRM
ncbi:hypothetical protein L218DRAFT_958760 [Marasmius fiardii PR-910]|nr:hypothetical protein L218DRAFT_958760 [Marasmius fiardii PR-910]